MRIGLITGEYAPQRGGVGDFTRQLGRALVGLGHEVHVITGRVELSALEEAKTAGVTLHRAVTHWGWKCWREVLLQAEEQRLEVLDLQYQTAAYRMHPAIHFVPRREARPPVVVTFHDLKVPYLFPKAGFLRWQVVRMLALRADRAIATNREDYLRLESEMSGSRLAQIPIGSNIPLSLPSGYDRRAERARWGAAPGHLLLGYFGFLNESKGVEDLIQALARLVEGGLPAHLLMLGGRVGSSDPTNRAYAERVERQVRDLGLSERVHWTDYGLTEDVSAGLLATDACVLPYRDGVSFRRGTLHACLAHGRAIVTTIPDVTLPEVRPGENMVLVEREHPMALANALRKLASDGDLRARLERGATALAADFTWEHIAQQTVRLFEGTAYAGRRA